MDFDINKNPLAIRIIRRYAAFGKMGYYVTLSLVTVLIATGLAYLIFPLITPEMPTWKLALAGVYVVGMGLLLSWGIVYSTVVDIDETIAAHSCKVGHNDDIKSAHYTMQVINEAKQWMLFYDYGERSQSNIYYNDEVEAALIQKLSSKFRVSMIFQESEQEINKLPLIRSLIIWQKDNPQLSDRVQIIYGVDRNSAEYSIYNGNCADFPYHYKINERAYSYLTKHEYDVKPDQRRFVYYTPWAGWPVQRVKDCLDFHTAVTNQQQIQ